MDRGARAENQRREKATESIESLRKLINDEFSHSPIRIGSTSRAHFEISKLKDSVNTGKPNFIDKVSLAK